MYHGVQLNKKLRPIIERDIAELRDWMKKPSGF
jgi:hypothetical protein